MFRVNLSFEAELINSRTYVPKFLCTVFENSGESAEGILLERRLKNRFSLKLYLVMNFRRQKRSQEENFSVIVI